ncbi:MAG: sensor histidine kinase [Caulobacterales bacterium 32-69-10]|nr:MAG: sensor histidine kinase [Caulobacterales bacterium 32-69-10]
MGANPASYSLRSLGRPSQGRRGEGPSAAAVRKHEQDELKRSFLRMVSHELRTPLNSIIGFSEIISCELYGPINEPRYREHAEIVRESGLKLLKLVNQVMEIARLEAGMADLDLHPEPLTPAVDEALIALDTEARARGLSFKTDMADGVAAVMADSRALRTILTNLLQNAVTFSPEGGEISISATLSARSVWIEIRDQGEGVEPAQLSRLIRPFEQGEAPLTRRSEGAGLGLPIVRLLCQAMDGTLKLESAPGQGFIARVRLPAAEPVSPA